MKYGQIVSSVQVEVRQNLNIKSFHACTDFQTSSHLIVIPIRAWVTCRKEGGCCIQAHATQVSAKCAAQSLHPPILPSFLPRERERAHVDPYSHPHEESLRLPGETGPTWVFGGFCFIHPSPLPTSLPLPPSPSVSPSLPLIYKPEL